MIVSIVMLLLLAGCLGVTIYLVYSDLPVEAPGKVDGKTSLEMVKRQFQGGGLIGDTPAEVSRALHIITAETDCSCSLMFPTLTQTLLCLIQMGSLEASLMRQAHFSRALFPHFLRIQLPLSSNPLNLLLMVL